MAVSTEAKPWTLDALHRLPDDGNKYELVRGELFVTPPPSEDHETVLAILSGILQPYVIAQRLGVLYHPRAVVRFEGSEVEPDLMVRRPRRAPARDWDDAPAPSLVVEVLSGSTRRRDQVQKRSLYLDAGVGEYWIVDPDRRTIRIVRRGEADLVASDEMRWQPEGADAALTFGVAQLFVD